MKSLMKASGIGTDRTGIVYEITTVIASGGGNILRLNSLQVAGDYAVTLVAEFDSDHAMQAVMHSLETDGIVGFRLTTGELKHYQPPLQDGRKHVITAIGFDRAGILESFSRLFRDRHLNLQSVQADVAAHMPNQGTRMFKSEFVVILALDYDTTELFKEIEHEALENGLTVHITIVS